MHRAWMVLLVVGTLLVAGCSSPGSPPSDDIDYPAGWSEAGLANTTAAVEGADGAIGDSDFVEHHAFIQPTPEGSSADAIVSVLVVRVDQDDSRLINQRRLYTANESVANRVPEEGVGVLDTETPAEEQIIFLNDTGAYRYQNLSGQSSGTVTQLDSGDYESAVDQPLPAVFASSVNLLARGNLSNPTATEAGIRYEVRNVSERPLSNASGHVTVGSDGLVSEFTVSQTVDRGRLAVAYDLEVGDVTIETPDWLG